jgi:hypothetical protein
MRGDRGQTTQDFAIGTSVLLVTIIGAFLYIQTGGLSVYEQPTAGVDQPQADRITSYLIEEYSAPGEPNTLRYDDGSGSIDVDLEDDESSGPSSTREPEKLSTLIDASGTNVASDRRTDPIVNVSIVNGTTLERGERVPARDGSDLLAWGEYRRADPVTSTRVVRLTNDGTTPQCTPTCWMVVRVW